MTNDRFEGVRPSIGSHRLKGILCVVILHFAAWYWVNHGPLEYIATPPVALPSNEIIFRFYDSSRRRESDRMEVQEVHHKAGVITLPALEKTHHRKAEPPHVTQSEIEPGRTNEVPSALPLVGEAPPLKTPVDAASVMDSEKVRKVIADIVAEEQREAKTSRTALGAKRSAAEEAIGHATRPKCEDGDATRAGNTQLTGLMKLPFLMVGADSDKGCKW